MIHFHMQRFKIIGFVVIEVTSSKEEEEDGKHGKNVEITFSDITYWLFYTFFTLISLKVQSTSN